MPESEVARLLRQIEQEHEAARRGLHAPAIVSSHAAITAHMENMGQCFEKLQPLVGGPEAAIKLIADLLKDK